MSSPMTWKGRELRSIGDLMNHGIDACASPEEAREFMRQYRRVNPAHAASNIGYLSGYYEPQRMRQIQAWFEVAHPIFGTATPSPENAFRAGLQMGREARMRGGA